ncbi:hypothetical protein [Terrimonas pollutisoli]|uniref:hypothetical protein n=1 Tax=Terrimonas pollutisoli TaxID=3034147 RepID=UPI0023EA83BF|nr:hypothetical protein [Terrimonas sp. H1YJ31]
MNKTEILIVGNTREPVEKTVGILNESEEWSGVEAFTDEEAITKFQQYQIDIVLLTKDVSDVQEKKLRKLFSFQNSDTVVARFEGNDEITLHNTINDILETEKAGKEFSFVVIDDALKNAGLNIRIQ